MARVAASERARTSRSHSLRADMDTSADAMRSASSSVMTAMSGRSSYLEAKTWCTMLAAPSTSPFTLSWLTGGGP